MGNVITLRVPESLYERVKKRARDDGISLNQYVQLALTEKESREQVLEMMEGRFNDLEETLKIMILKRELEIGAMLDKELARLNRRYALMEKRTRSFHSSPPPAHDE